jgi:hypothetical protein
VIGRRRDKSESRLQEYAFVTDPRGVVFARPILANSRISYVTPSLQHGIVCLAEAPLSAVIPDYCGAKNGISQP